LKYDPSSEGYGGLPSRIDELNDENSELSEENKVQNGDPTAEVVSLDGFNDLMPN